ncbi:MAG: hypothetical protein JXR12_01445 [Neptunomonas phycophila]|uniref:hypothetical protein n=1 Tax=Neptunomonas phycophila TaxID=1572645 RepID=UPI003B8C58EC
MSFNFSRNIAGATNFVNDAVSGGKQFINNASDSLFGVKPFDEPPAVPGSAGEQAKQAQQAVQGAGSSTPQYDEQTLRQYNDWKADELKKDHQKRAQEIIDTNNFAVRLENPQNGDVIAFRVSPESINESRQAIYKQLEPLHMPGAVQVFTHTTPRNWAVSGVKLFSRNGVEAEDNLQTVNMLRSWLAPYFGESKTAGRDNYQGEMLGAPPPVLLFSAYSDGKLQSSQQGNSSVGGEVGGMGILRNIPVVIQSLNIPFNNDIDYIQTKDSNQPFPAILPLDFQLVETHSPADFSGFDIVKYKQGILEGF